MTTKTIEEPTSEQVAKVARANVAELMARLEAHLDADQWSPKGWSDVADLNRATACLVEALAPWEEV